jgi:hypothetical protein
VIFGLWFKLQIAGYSYSNPVTGTGTDSDYADRFDPDKMMNKTNPNIADEFFFLGTIYSGLMTLWNVVGWIFAGFPAFLFGLGGAIADPTTRTAYQYICGALGVVTSFIITIWIIQLVTGRQVQD